MKRRTKAIIITGVLGCLSLQESYGQFSEFARITPETEKRYAVSLQILPAEGQEGKYKIIPPKVHQAQIAYLIICREQVPPEKQDFRGYIWYRDRHRHRYGNRSWDRPEILSVAPLLPYGLYEHPDPSYVVPPTPNHVILDRSLLGRSYIYIDYPSHVLDGGYFYCFDLSTYPLPEERTLRVRYSPAKGLGPEKGVMRRDPSDILKVGNLYYVWYTKSRVAHGYDATIWYATSPDGHTWI